MPLIIIETDSLALQTVTMTLLVITALLIDAVPGGVLIVRIVTSTDPSLEGVHII